MAAIEGNPTWRHLAALGWALTTLSGSPRAESNWLYLGDSEPSATWPTGQVSIDLGSLHRRGKHHEIWERTVFQLDASQRWTWLPSEDQPERRSLWALRCSRQAMALVSWGFAGTFEPRAEKLQYFVPAPGSAYSAILAASCQEILRHEPSPSAPTATPLILPEDPVAARKLLERPPADPYPADESEDNDE